jgi:hypothetical protein
MFLFITVLVGNLANAASRKQPEEIGCFLEAA